MRLLATTFTAIAIFTTAGLRAEREDVLIPMIDGAWWQIAGNPDLGKYSRKRQQPVDFGVWQATDGTWQLWSCIRSTGCGGCGRLFYRWEGKKLTDKNWRPMGIAMEARPELGETPGGLQAPHVVRHQRRYIMAYGDWLNICFATSKDGKHFERIIQPNGKTGVFTEGPGANTRDPMLIRINGLWHCYYTAFPHGRGYGFCRMSPDLARWSPSCVVCYGGKIGTAPCEIECPQVVEPQPGVFYYLRNQFYGRRAMNWVYRSRNPLNFGIDDDTKLVRNWRVAAPEIIHHEGQYYIASLLDSLQGIKMARLKWIRLPKLGIPLIARAENAASDLGIDNIIHAPAAPGDWPAWRERLARWRAETRKKLRYDDSFYGRKEFAWAASDFACCLAMMCDLTFYDPPSGSYQVDALLDRGRKKFGGYDSIILWHAYPRIGFDERNQFDFYRDMPGGLEGLRDLTRQLHARGVKVFIDYNPWDTGTRREGKPDVDALAEMVKAIEADGILLDTMKQAGEAFRTKLDQTRPGVVLESELVLPLKAIEDHHMSWAQWFKDSQVPGVLKNKWYERRHMQHQIKRWDDDHTAELQTAWINGSGMMVWENVFGSLKLWSPRDRSILRSILPIQRRYHRLFAGEGWKPLVPAAPAGVYASLWHGNALRLWTLVNRTDKPVEGRLQAVEPGNRPQRWFDLIAGREIVPVTSAAGLRVSVPLGPRGVGAVVAGDDAALGRDFATFLAAQRKVAAEADFSPRPPMRRPRLKPVAPTRKYQRDKVPAGMVPIDVDRRLEMRSTITSRECGFYVEPFGHDALRKHKQPIEQVRKVRLRPYAIDLTPVTNAQFAKFLEASGYRPKHTENFLKHWRNGKPPQGREDHPVVYVDLDDARNYARWAGKRLPTEEEWQYAAAGPKALPYPWGSQMKSGCCNAGATGGTTPVNAFPEGRSPWGCYDMCGNTWEWTQSQRSDGRTRFCILKGGSWYRAAGSHWYADGGPQPTRHAAKFLLMWPGLDRCSTIGLRCVVDMAEK